MSYKNNYLLKIEPWPRLTWVVNLDTECGLLFNYCITTLLSLLTRDSYHYSGNYITYSELHYVCIYILLPCLSISIFLIPFDPSAERLTDDRLTHLNPWNLNFQSSNMSPVSAEQTRWKTICNYSLVHRRNIFQSLFGWTSEKKDLIDWAQADQRKRREGGTTELRRNWYVRDISLNWGRINR